MYLYNRSVGLNTYRWSGYTSQNTVFENLKLAVPTVGDKVSAIGQHEWGGNNYGITVIERSSSTVITIHDTNQPVTAEEGVSTMIATNGAVMFVDYPY